MVALQASNVDLKPKLTNEAKDLYDKLLQVMGSAITEANSTCNDALNAAKQYALEIEAAAKTEIQGALDSFQAQLDELNKKAKDAGNNIYLLLLYYTIASPLSKESVSNKASYFVFQIC